MGTLCALHWLKETGVSKFGYACLRLRGLFPFDTAVNVVDNIGNSLVSGDITCSTEAVLREMQRDNQLLHRFGEAEHGGNQTE